MYTFNMYIMYTLCIYAYSIRNKYAYIHNISCGYTEFVYHKLQVSHLSIRQTVRNAHSLYIPYI